MKKVKTMNKRRYYKYLFIFGGLYNLIVSTSFIITSIFLVSMFSAYGVVVPPSMIWLQSALFLIIVFGIGYFIVSKDITKNHGIVIIGIIAKLGIFSIFLIYFIKVDLGILVLLLASVDIAFPILFIEFLLNFKKL